METKNTRTRASAPRFRASSPRTLTLAFVRACCICMRVRDPGPHYARASPSLATRMWITRGCGGSTHAMARPWMLMSVLTRSASAWAVLGPRNLSLAPPATLASWTRARRMPPAAPWARPRVVTTPSPLSYTQPHNNVTTPLRWRYLASSLARTCDLLMSFLTSALGNAYTALDVSICSPHALEPGTDCTQSRVEAKLEYYGPTFAALLRQNISYTPIVWSAYGRPHPDTLTVLRSLSKSIARKRNIASAEVVFHRLHSSITLEIWRRSARQIRTCWPVTDLRRGLLPRPGSLAFVSRVLAPVSSSRALVLVSVLPALTVLALLRICHGRPWRLATLAPQGLGPGAPCLTASVSLFVSAVSPSLVPFAVRLWHHVSRR